MCSRLIGGAVRVESSGGGIARAENGRERERKGGAYVQKQTYN